MTRPAAELVRRRST